MPPKFDAAAYQAAKLKLSALNQHKPVTTPAPATTTAAAPSQSQPTATPAAAAAAPAASRVAPATPTGQRRATLPPATAAAAPAVSATATIAAAKPKQSATPRSGRSAIASAAAAELKSALPPSQPAAALPATAAAAAAAASAVSASDAAASDDSGTTTLFSVKMLAFQEQILQLFNSFGLKYSVDASIKTAIADLESLYSRDHRHATARLNQTRDAQLRAEAELAKLIASTEATLAAARAAEAERTAKLIASHKLSLKQLTKQLNEKHDKAMAEAAAERSSRLSREAETKLRAEIRTQLEAERPRGMEEKIRVLEEQAVTTIRQKEEQIQRISNDQNKLQIKAAQLESECLKLRTENVSLKDSVAVLRVRIVELEGAATEQRATNERLRIAHDTMERSKQSDQLIALQQYKHVVEASSDSQRVLEQKISKLERVIDDLKRENESELRRAKAAYELELETVHRRVKALVNKKNLQLSQLKELHEQTKAKLVSTEQFLKQTRDQLTAL